MGPEQKLSEVLSEFARTLLTDFPIQGILDQLVGRIVEVLPISAAGVTLIAPGADPHLIAASDDTALRYEQLQSELNEGPCVAAYLARTPVLIPDLAACTDFPAFAPRALEGGLGAVFTFPLHHGDRALGALDLYRDVPGALDADQVRIAQTLADVASAYLLNAQARADLLVSAAHDRHLSLHDSLTGLPNRGFLVERLRQALRQARRSGCSLAVLFVDLDDFKAVNDLHGHRTGDELLVAVADRLAMTLRPGDTVARPGGDEFVILCEDLETGAHVEQVAARVSAVFATPFVLDRVVVAIKGSIGIALPRPGDEEPEVLLDAADQAMYQAKRGGGARHAYASAATGPPRSTRATAPARAGSSGGPPPMPDI